MEASRRQPTSPEEVRTLWIGGLKNWVDENFLYSCFAHTAEVRFHPTIRARRACLIRRFEADLAGWRSDYLLPR
jgi:hypothetical protein